MNEEEDEVIDEPEIIRAKWVMDGAKTLQEAAEMLRYESGRLLELAEQGWELIQPVEDDYGFIEKKEK